MRNAPRSFRWPRLRPRRHELPGLGWSLLGGIAGPVMLALLKIIFATTGPDLVYATSMLVAATGW